MKAAEDIGRPFLGSASPDVTTDHQDGYSNRCSQKGVERRKEKFSKKDEELRRLRRLRRQRKT